MPSLRGFHFAIIESFYNGMQKLLKLYNEFMHRYFYGRLYLVGSLGPQISVFISSRLYACLYNTPKSKSYTIIIRCRRYSFLKQMPLLRTYHFIGLAAKMPYAISMRM